MRSRILLICLAGLISASCNDCNGEERVIDDIVSLQLNFQVCRDSSAFETRGLTISPWSGELRRASPGAEGGDASFSVAPTSLLSPRIDSPEGRSWFRVSGAENLRPGEWHISVVYAYGGPSPPARSISGRVTVQAAGSSVYLTEGIDEASLSSFPACP